MTEETDRSMDEGGSWPWALDQTFGDERKE